MSGQESASLYKNRVTKTVAGFLLLGVFFSFGANEAEAAPIKILSNTRHAYGTIISTIDQLLGRAHTSAEFVIHSTSLGSTYSGGVTEALSSISRYSESGVLVPSQAPYHLYTSSFSGYSGDFNTINYNHSATYDLADNYAYITGDTSWLPPAFRVAPGWLSQSSGPGVEWRIDPALFCSTSLSCTTAANAGILAWLRFLHPTWNWFDTKAALRQNGSNWATGYSTTAYGFGLVDHAAASTLTDGQIVLQPPAATVVVSAGRISFTVYPFKQTRRVKEVLFQFSAAPVFHANELSLSEIEALGGTKITEYTGITATTVTPIYAATTNAYFAWFTADNSTDSAASFSRIDTYSVLGPVSQNEVPFNGTFTITSPANNAISGTASPTFTWGAAGSYLGISKYQLFIDGVLDTDNISGTSATPTTPLSDGPHTWYVKTFNGGGATLDTTSTPAINVLSGYAAGYTFYVDNVLGNDTNPGTQAFPWATLTRAGSTAAAGDTVVIMKNSSQPYREIFTASKSGTADSPITFRGVDAQHKPEIWGSTDVSSGWSVYGGGNADTYQQSFATDPWVFAAGPSLANLTKRAWGESPATLNPGEMYWENAVLYYRLDAGEVLGNLRIEVSTRNRGISSSQSYVTFQDIIIRYVNSYGVWLLGTNSIAQGLEVYDSDRGVYLDETATLRYSVVVGNAEYGVHSQYSSSNIYNSLMYGNAGGGIKFFVYGEDSPTVKNTILAGNTGYSFFFHYYSEVPPFTASNNAWDVAGDSSWTILKGTDNQELVDPLFASPSARDFRLQPLSPNIDMGTDVGFTADILGNPIYGAPDIGPYEYQPPYTMGTDEIDIAGAVRVYADGKFRNTAATSGVLADLTVVPSGGFGTGDYAEWMNIVVNTWDTAGARNKNWTETSTILGAASTVHTVGDLEANKYYEVKVDGSLGNTIAGPGCSGGVCLSDALGKITFTYTGGYSTHTFDVAAGDNAVPDLSGGLPAGVLHRDATDTALSVTTTEESTCRYGTVAGIAYADMPYAFATTGGTTHSTPLSSLTKGEDYRYYVRCQDSTGNIAETDYSISFSVAPSSLQDEANIGSPTIKVGKTAQRLTKGKTTYFKKNNFILSGKDASLRSGKVEIFREGKKEVTVQADEEGKWKTSLRIQTPGEYELSFRYKDQYGTVVATQKRTVVLDTESPVFLSFPAAHHSVTVGATPLFWAASDNEKFKKYSIFFAGKKYVQESGTFILPKNVPRGWQMLRVQAEDYAGNRSNRVERIFVKE